MLLDGEGANNETTPNVCYYSKRCIRAMKRSEDFWKRENWKSMKNCLSLVDATRDKKGGGGLDETEKKFRPRSINRFKISNYRGGTFIIDLLKHLLLEQFYYPTILLSDYILLFEKYFSVRSVFTYIYIYIYRYTRIEFISSG